MHRSQWVLKLISGTMFTSILNPIPGKKQDGCLTRFPREVKWKWNSRTCSGATITEAAKISLVCNGCLTVPQKANNGMGKSSLPKLRDALKEQGLTFKPGT